MKPRKKRERETETVRDTEKDRDRDYLCAFERGRDKQRPGRREG